MDPQDNTRQTTTDRTEHERLLYQQLEAAARDLWQEMDETCDDLGELVEMAAQGDATPEICHQIDERIRAIVRKHTLLLCLSHATQAVYESNSLANRA